MEEEIKVLEEFVKENRNWHCIECGYNCEKDMKTEQAIENLINKYKEQEKIIELMAKDIEKITGSCPFDLYDYQVKDCDNICQMLADNGKQYTCFIEYYEKKAKGE